MAQCGGCREKLSFLEGIQIDETVFSSALFRTSNNGRWPGVSSSKVCVDCAVRLALQISNSVGAKSCVQCRALLESCSLPIERKYLGLWRRGIGSNLEFVCVGCSDKKKSSHVTNPDQWIQNDDGLDNRHPWQDYADDDPGFWESLGD